MDRVIHQGVRNAGCLLEVAPAAEISRCGHNKARLSAWSDAVRAEWKEILCLEDPMQHITSRLLSAATHPVVIGAVDVSGHAKVSDLDHQALSHQTVAGCQVAVDEVQGRQVHHARGDLGSNVQHLGQCELTQRGHLRLLQDTSVRAVSSVGDTPGTR